MRNPGPKKTSYAIQRPAKTTGKGKRRSFAIQAVTGTKRVPIESEALDAINGLLLGGVISPGEADRQVVALRAALYKERDRHQPSPVFASENQALLGKYWAAEYADRELVDPNSARWGLERAVAAVGNLSLVGAAQTDLQQAVMDHAPDDSGKRRLLITGLNQLLQFAGREFTLRKPKPVREEILHVTAIEFEHMLAQIKKADMKLLCRVAFCTGARVGEAIGLTERSLRPDHVLITTQLDDKFERRETKTRSVRKAAILEGWEHYVAEWVALDAKTKRRLRKLQHAPLIHRACARAFPGREDKDLCFHDLRHSYAAHLVSHGVPISLVAQSLGNSVSVCEMYYSGFVLTDDSVTRIRTIMRGSK